MLYVSGQLPIRADKALWTTWALPRRPAGHRQYVGHPEAAAGRASDLCRVTAYIVGVENWPEFNRVYADMLGDARPANGRAGA
jgi:enamine deaminase RidA (YjgF/YER057c/UK114 family)